MISSNYYQLDRDAGENADPCSASALDNLGIDTGNLRECQARAKCCQMLHSNVKFWWFQCAILLFRSFLFHQCRLELPVHHFISCNVISYFYESFIFNVDYFNSWEKENNLCIPFPTASFVPKLLRATQLYTWMSPKVMAPRSQVAFAMKNARHDTWILWNRHAGIQQVASNILPSHWWWSPSPGSWEGCNGWWNA